MVNRKSFMNLLNDKEFEKLIIISEKIHQGDVLCNFKNMTNIIDSDTMLRFIREMNSLVTNDFDTFRAVLIAASNFDNCGNRDISPIIALVSHAFISGSDAHKIEAFALISRFKFRLYQVVDVPEGFRYLRHVDSSVYYIFRTLRGIFDFINNYTDLESFSKTVNMCKHKLSMCVEEIKIMERYEAQIENNIQVKIELFDDVVYGYGLLSDDDILNFRFQSTGYHKLVEFMSPILDIGIDLIEYILDYLIHCRDIDEYLSFDPEDEDHKPSLIEFIRDMIYEMCDIADFMRPVYKTHPDAINNAFIADALLLSVDLKFN